MTIGDEAYLPKPFPHAEAQSVVPAMSTLAAPLRSIAMESKPSTPKRKEK
jgi:hypothetical protein